MPAAAREFDVVLFGATGFVGRLTAARLARHAPPQTRIALAGRSTERLQRAQSEFGVEWPVLAADASDRQALDAMVGRTKVVASTVGPYAQYGMPLVEACAGAGTHYCDITGEVLFMRDSIERADAPAKSTGARIVHACGFDSIPSDLGTWLLHQAAGEPLDRVTLVVESMRGGFSGGTIASLEAQLDQVRSDRAIRNVVFDPYTLSPDRANEPDLGKQSDFHGPQHDPELGGWVVPFMMASVNTRVVRRTNALLGYAYGESLRYREVLATGDGFKGQAAAFGMATGMSLFMLGLALPPTRWVLDRVLPSPGEGPSEEARRKGSFRISLHGQTTSGRKVVARVRATGDPGYEATAVMLSESALALALDADALPQRAGVLTPVTAMGAVLRDRLVAAGHTYEVEPG